MKRWREMVTCIKPHLVMLSFLLSIANVGVASAAPVTIVNPGFELGDFTGWTCLNNNGPGSDGGVVASNSGFADVSGHGSYIAWDNWGHLDQQVGVIQANTTYTLTVQAGWPSYVFGWGWNGGDIRFVTPINGVPTNLAVTFLPSFTTAESGTFKTVTVSWTSPASGFPVGNDLHIQMWSYAPQVAWDNVTLDATAKVWDGETYFTNVPGVAGIRYSSNFFGYNSAVNRPTMSGELAYDYSEHIILDGSTYRLYSGGFWYQPGLYNGDHVLQFTSLTGEGGTWTMPHSERPEFYNGGEEGHSGTWYQGQSLEPEVVKVNGVYYMYAQVEIVYGQPIDISGQTAQGIQADRIQLFTSSDGSNWTRYTERGVVTNVADPTHTALHHQEVVYCPWDVEGKPFWMYVGYQINPSSTAYGSVLGHYRIRSNDPYTFDWNNRESTWLPQWGNQISYAYQATGGPFFVRITETADSSGRIVPSLCFSREGLTWTWGGHEGDILLEGSTDNNNNKNCYFLGMSTIDGKGELEYLGNDTYHAIYAAATSNTPISPEILYSEVGCGDLTFQLIRPAVVQGVVRSSASGNPPIAGVTVRSIDGTSQTTTDSNGAYTLEHRGGTFTIEALSAAYAPSRKSVTAGEGVTITGQDFVLDYNSAFEADTAFSTSNPSFTWSYGWCTAAGANFTVYDRLATFANDGLVRWDHEDTNYWRGGVIKNVTGQGIDMWGAYLPAGTIAAHPGTTDFFQDLFPVAVVRWTAPYAGTFKIIGKFTGANHTVGGTSTDVHILKNNSELWSAIISGFVGGGGYPSITPDTATQVYDGTLTLAAGDILDFAVGSDGENSYDFTGIVANIINTSALTTLSGTVTSNLSGNPPVEGAKISVVGHSYETVTDISGHYSMSLPFGTYTIAAGDDNSAYISKLATVTLASSAAVQDFRLQAKTFNAAAEYNWNSNPSGAWTYLSQQTLGTDLLPYDVKDSYGTGNWLERWLGFSGSTWTGAVAKNTDSIDHTDMWGMFVKAGGMYLNPGWLGTPGSYSVVRWTSPYDAPNLKVAATFSGIDFNTPSTGTTTDVHILKNGANVWNSNVAGFVGCTGVQPITLSTSVRSYAGTIPVLKGDTIDFVVGPGSNDPGNDATGLDATISPVSGVVSGLIKSDIPGNPPVANATVSTLDGISETLTDSSGAYSLEVSPGEVTLVASRDDSYLPQQVSLNVNDGATLTQNFTLAHKTSFGAGAGYSRTDNPNGVWTYLWQSPLGVDQSVFDLAEGWYDWLSRWTRIDGTDWRGHVSANTSDVDHEEWSTYFEAHSIVLQPGVDSPGLIPLTVVRWTAPYSGRFDVAATFTGQCFGKSAGTTTDVYVLKNGTELWNASVQGFVGGGTHLAVTPETATRAYSGAISVTKGDSIDFVVGPSTDGFDADGTGLDLTITEAAGISAAGLSEVKAFEDGTPVSITVAKVVTASSTTFVDGSYYIEDADRSAGIKVIPLAGLPAVGLGDRITLTGMMATDVNGERYINAYTITKSTGQQVGPVGVTNKSAVGESGLSISGLLARIWGDVTFVQPGQYAYVDDGSGMLDNSGHQGIRVILSGLASPVTKNVTGHYVAVTGLIGRASVGATDAPAIRPRGDSDISIY
ncbi:MAG: carboxypeptidase regulatory-like domain-containing protein [Armatimonadota bacterium]